MEREIERDGRTDGRREGERETETETEIERQREKDILITYTFKKPLFVDSFKNGRSL